MINAIVPANCTGAQPSGQSSSGLPQCPSPSHFPRGQNQRNEIVMQSHGGTQNQHQWNSYKNQNGNHHHHQRHGGRRNHEHANQNFNGSYGFTQAPRGIPGFVIHPPPPSMRPVLDQYMLPTHLPFYHFGDPTGFHGELIHIKSIDYVFYFHKKKILTHVSFTFGTTSSV